MGWPEGHARPAHAALELDCDEVVDGDSECLGVSTNCSPYHTGYTTNHWLRVFRAVEATA
jgi:hypothetical protein